MMNSEDPFDAFPKIEKVEAPAFLFTRIKERIRQLAEAPAPASWKWAFALVSTILLIINAGFLYKRFNDTKPSTEMIINSMQLNPSNQLYDE